jgi:hypothetical protein
LIVDRRQFLKDTGRGIAVASILGPALYLSPAEARTRKLPLKVLNDHQLKTLEAAAEVLVPGATEAGVGYFIDEQLSRHPNDSLLMAQYLNVPPPYANFYIGAVMALDGFAQGTRSKAFAKLSEDERDAIIGGLFPKQPAGWQGPPSEPVYLCLRADAVDVVYGTMAGFESLEVPYLAHIEPEQDW